MDNLWAPWRIQYIQAKKTKGCIFCQKPKQKKDRINYIVVRKKYVYSLLNIFPYNNGHVLIAPFRHVAELDKLNGEEKLELLDLVIETTKILKAILKPHGFNIGMNVGKTAGAGIDAHLHVHVVPRWNADTNFMPVLTETKIISQSLDELYRMIKP
ncbi:MAG: HIT domain-containing protein [Candidatus Omnitrophica bacterium]|nr:HIT domain-containing protein [Candidatus Omnitrophota bacterium]MBU4478905.1 HIT domain-containing protein [Candidatus Omnitrophota bacterium]MCG2704366.1 HIT domain-containing protein [Candidatus Omnitrophota bacterium]